MFEMNLKPWEKVTEEFERLKPILMASANPVLTGTPETGKLYRIYPKDAVSGNDTPYHGNVRVGSDGKKLLVYLNGGGCSFDEYSAARPWNAFTLHQTDTYYSNDAEWFADWFIRMGVGDAREDNPFNTWSLINLPYANGDFHSGDGEFPYTAQDGTPAIMQYRGYRNVMNTIALAKTILPDPDTLLIAGSSAGGFGTAMLADDIIEAFPAAKNITVCVDSSLLLCDRWRSIATNVWHSPEHLIQRIKSDNLTLDHLTALHWKRPEIKILFLCSVRDALLTVAQCALDGKGQTHTKTDGDRFCRDLKTMCADLQSAIPNVGLYIFTGPMDAPGYDEDELTLHCALNNRFLFDHTEEGATVTEWLTDAVNGTVRTIGLSHLED